AVGQIAVKQQERHLVEPRVFDQLPDRVAAVAQAALDGGYGRLAGDDLLQPGGVDGLAHVAPPVVCPPPFRFSPGSAQAAPAGVSPGRSKNPDNTTSPLLQRSGSRSSRGSGWVRSPGREKISKFGAC